MAIGDYRHDVGFENPGPYVPDEDGGYAQTWTPTTPATWKVSIRPATGLDLERATAGTVLTHASVIVEGRYFAAVSTASRMLFKGRIYQVTSAVNVDERDLTMVLVADVQT